MPKYTVTSPIKHKGKRIEPGKTVDMDEETAQPLIDAGALAAPEKPAKKKEGEDK